MKQSNGLADARDVSDRLYRAALGPDPGDRDLRRFQALDAGTARWPVWHWGAFLSAIGWMALRGLFGAAALWAFAALLGSVLALGLARLVFGADARMLAAVLLALTAGASLAWGLAAVRLHHRITRRRILQAVGTHDSLAAACAHLQRRQPGQTSRWAVLLVLGGAMLAALAALRPALQPLVLATLQQAPGSASASASAPTPAPAPAPALAPAPVPAPLPVAAAPPAPEPIPEPAPAVPEPPASTAAAPLPRPAPRESTASTRYAVQIGVFAEAANARAALAKLKAAGLAASADDANAQGHQRVRAGPFATLAQAQRAAERIQALGLPAVVVRVRGAGG